MKITPIINSYSFKSISRDVVKKDGKVFPLQPSTESGKNSELLYSNYTTFFRQDLDLACPYEYGLPIGWNGFIKTIQKYFENTPKVNVYDFACSDGSEAYSLAMTLIDKMGNKADKFFPIKAYDIDSEMIEVAQSEKILFSEDDYESMKFTIRKPYQNYFSLSASNNERYKFLFTPKPQLQEKIEFKQGDIEQLIDSVEPSNSLVLIRNVWPYLDNAQEIYEKLANRLESNSLVVLGMFDNDSFWKDYSGEEFEKICPFIYRKK